MTATHAATTRSRRFRFRTRTLLIVVALLCAALALVGARLRDVRRQQQAVAAIQNAGGDVLYDYEYDFTSAAGRPPGWRRSETPSPVLLHLLGRDAVADVVYVQFDGPRTTDAVLANLDSLRSVQHLHLKNTRVSGDAIKKLQSSRPKLSITGDAVQAR